MRHIILILLCILSFSCSTTVFATERHALVIGNSNYAEGTLDNPINDATDMAAQLQSMGYKIHGGAAALDLDRLGIERALDAFARQLPEGATALFYYAGHGMGFERANYLIPVKHNIETEDDLPDRAVSLRRITSVLENANPKGVNIALLDACRDNPLKRGYRTTRNGLTKEEIPYGVFVGYAAGYGQVAEDGNGRNGTYTAELLNVLREQPGEIIEVAHKTVANRVIEKSNGKQKPAFEGNVYGNWCFGECTDKPTGTVAVTPPTETSPAYTPPEPQRINTKWLIAGGVVAAALIAGLLNQGGNDDNPPIEMGTTGGTGGTSGTTTFTLNLTPP